MAWLDTRQATFMLLPDFNFLPGGKVDLGRVLPQTKEKKLPDPRRAFNEARLDLTSGPVNPDQEYNPWHWNSDESFKSSAGISVDLSLLTGIGAGIDGKLGSNQALDIQCKRLVQKTYNPGPEDFDKLLKDDTISRLLKKIDRPSVFLITGLMIAYEATIEITQGKECGGGSHINADVTSTGIPLNMGLKGDVNRTQNSKLVVTPKEPFILAYQLCRLRRKLLGGYDDAIDTRATLFSGETPVLGSESLADFEIKMFSSSEMLETQ